MCRIIVFLSILITAVSPQYINTPIHTNPGLYYEHIKNVKIINSYWDIVAYIDRSSFDQKLDIILKSFSKTKELCEPLHSSSFAPCTTSLKVLGKLIPNLRKQKETLESLMSHSISKRGWFDLIGTGLKTVFGTLDQQDAEFYNNAINSVGKNEHQFAELLKQQVQVVKTTITNFNHTVNDLNRNEKFLVENFEKISNLSINNTNQYFDLKFKLALDEHFNILTLMTTELEIQFSNLIDTILFARSNTLHPLVITPPQMIIELRKTLFHLKSSTSYPIPLNIEEAHRFLDIITIRHHLSPHRICFVIRIPIVENTDFSLYNLIPLPVHHRFSGNFVFILPSAEYLAVSVTKMSYTLLKNIGACGSISRTDIICGNSEPIYSLNTRKICETQLLAPIDKVPDSCETRIMPGNFEIWHKLQKPNSWIYVLPDRTDVTINCINETPKTIILNSTGIITLSSNCDLYSSTVTLNSEVSVKESSFNSILPPFDLLVDCCSEDTEKLNNATIHFVPYRPVNLDTESLKMASHKLDDISKMAEKLQESSYFSQISNNSYFAYILCTLLKVALIYVAYRLFKYFKNRCRSPLKLRHSHENNCITNCLTLNFCKSRERETTIELEDVDEHSPIETGETTKPRRSARIAKIKDHN